MHIWVSKLTIIGLDNGLLPGWHQAIIWTNAGLLLNGSLGTFLWNFNWNSYISIQENVICEMASISSHLQCIHWLSLDITLISFIKIHLKIPFFKWHSLLPIYQVPHYLISQLQPFVNQVQAHNLSPIQVRGFWDPLHSCGTPNQYQVLSAHYWSEDI